MQGIPPQRHASTFAHADLADEGVGPRDGETAAEISHGGGGRVHAGDVEDGADLLDAATFLADEPAAHAVEFELGGGERLGA